MTLPCLGPCAGSTHSGMRQQVDRLLKAGLEDRLHAALRANVETELQPASLAALAANPEVPGQAGSQASVLEVLGTVSGE